MLVYGMSTTLVPPQAWSSGVHQTSHWNTPHSTVHTNVHTNQAVHTAAAPFIAHLNTLQQGPSHTLAQLDAWQQGPSHTVAIDFGAMWDVMGQQAQAVVAAVKHVAGEHGWRVLVLRGSMIAGEHGAVAGGHGDVDAVSEIRYTGTAYLPDVGRDPGMGECSQQIGGYSQQNNNNMYNILGFYGKYNVATITIQNIT